ncbi:MAG TPA: hypothetical protein VMF89_20840 [Polyangiales bacterium]|nr:hypothetical protein [Polyangiales bacterium]
MFFFKKKKPEVPTLVEPTVGSSLARQQSWPNVMPAPVKPAALCWQYALDGTPPQASFREGPIVGQDRFVYVTQGSADNPPLALVNMPQRVEIWELSRDATPAFLRKRSVQFDPKQDDWINMHLTEIACLPKDRLLLQMGHSGGTTLHIYDVAANSCTTLSAPQTLSIVPEKQFQSAQTFIDSTYKMFDLLLVEPQQMLVLFNTGRLRVSADVYYGAPSFIYAFTPRHPDGVKVMQLGADDGIVDRWMTLDKTLWLSTQDFRDPKQRKSSTFSLDLHTVLGD